MLEILKKTRKYLKTFQMKKWSDRISSNQNKGEIKKELRCILNLISGLLI